MAYPLSHRSGTRSSMERRGALSSGEDPSRIRLPGASRPATGRVRGRALPRSAPRIDLGDALERLVGLVDVDPSLRQRDLEVLDHCIRHLIESEIPEQRHEVHTQMFLLGLEVSCKRGPRSRGWGTTERGSRPAHQRLPGGESWSFARALLKDRGSSSSKSISELLTLLCYPSLARGAA